LPITLALRGRAVGLAQRTEQAIAQRLAGLGLDGDLLYMLRSPLS
jgi:hypothetical protein